jgi:hypothetical protein
MLDLKHANNCLLAKASVPISLSVSQQGMQHPMHNVGTATEAELQKQLN